METEDSEVVVCVCGLGPVFRGHFPLLYDLRGGLFSRSAGAGAGGRWHLSQEIEGDGDHNRY